MSENDNKPAKEEEPAMDFAEFLALTPPYSEKKVIHFQLNFISHLKLNTPDILLHCPSSICENKGTLFHNCVAHDSFHRGASPTHIYSYKCSNCQNNYKTYAVNLIGEIESDNISAKCVKVGEYPSFGTKVPSRLLNMIGKDRDLFLKGRVCENQGLGIGSFSYYRRVIENQKNRLFDQIIQVTKLLDADSHLIEELKIAKKENQFTKSIDVIKTGLPQTLFISGENPLTLLHGALSEGLHAKSDEECLEIAGNIRVVLTVLAQSITNALNDDKELTNAVKGLKLLKAKA